MYHYCKLCGECMKLICHESIGRWTSADILSHFKCPLCPEYFAIFSAVHQKIITEKLLLKNFGFVFNAISRDAVLWKERKPLSARIHLKVLPLNELTPELAVQWVNKLKTYVVFQ